MKRTLSFLLTLLMLVTSLPLNAFMALAEGIVAEEAEEEAVSVESFRGKTVSILSHSASTYDGVSNPASENWPILNTDLTHIICYGQSFSTGSDAPLYPDSPVDGVYVLGSITSGRSGDSLKTLDLITGNQHPIISAGNSLQQKLQQAGIHTDLILGSYGSGGRTIAQLMSDARQAEIKAEEGYTYDCLSSGRYEVFQNSVSALAEYAENNGKTVGCPVIVYLQGETDQNTDEQLGYPENPARAGYGAGGDKEKYKEYMTRLKEDMQKEVMEAYGQSEKPLFLIYQVSGTYVRTQYSSINMAQLEFARENEDVILVQTPYFTSHYTGSHHLTVNGYRWLGEHIARSMYTALVERQKSYPLLPEKVTYESQRSVRITVSGAENGLTVDTWTVEDATDSKNKYGFYLTVNGTTVVPQTVSVDGNEILLTLPEDGLPLNKANAVYVYYGGKGAKGTGNIRDNCSETGFYAYLDDSNDTGTGNNQSVSYSALDENGDSLIGRPYPLYNWLASFCYKLEIPAEEQKQDSFYHWEMQETGLVSVSEDQNELTLLEGTVENGILNGVQYGMAKPVVLYHDKPWAIQWKAAGNGNSYGGGMLLAGDKGPNLYLPADSRGFVAWNQSNNYGFRLKDLGIDTRLEHTYRIENRIASDGTNTIYLTVDGAEIGAMNVAYSTSNSSAVEGTTDWANGTDICLRYMGLSTSFLLKNLKLSYLKIWECTHTYQSTVTPPTCTEKGYTTYTCECGESYVEDETEATGHSYENDICTICGAKATLPLSYDDHYDVTGKEVEIVDAGTPTSYQVGYGVAEGTLDTAVVTLDGDKLIATGIGTAKVRIDGVTYTVTVKAAPISLIMITGHSMGAGQKGSATQSVICPEGQVYSSHGTKNLGSSTTGVGISYAALTKAKNVNAFTLAGEGTIGEGSALAWEYNKLTGEKVWVLNTAVGGSNLSEWIPGTTNYKNAVAQFRRAQAILSNEIRAGHYTLSDMGILYHNGANFAYRNVEYTQQDLQNWYDSMWSGFKTEFSTDLDGNGTNETASFLGLIPIWTKSGGVSYTEDEPAGLFMAASDEYPDIFTASVIGRDWLTNANVAAKFPEIAYTTQNETVILRPTTTAEVFSSDNVHYLQVGYNAVGIDIARNIVDYLNGTDETPKVTILASDGKTAAADEIELSYNTPLLLTPVVEPITVSDLTFEVSGCVSLSYPLQITATQNGEGALTVSYNGQVLKKILFSCANAPSHALPLSYDDRYNVTGKEVEIVDAGTPTSYQVGYGVAEGTLDTAVVTLVGDKLIATGIGTAKVRIDGVTYTVTVKAAPISLLLLIGQSNMRGSEGNAAQSIVCPDGMVYSTYGDDRGDAEGIMNVNNATNFAASALAGAYSTVNVNGNTDNLSYYPLNSLTADGNGTFGPDSGFAYEWVQQTGEKVWIVNAAHGGSSITSWVQGATNFKEAVLLFSACQETLQKEIAAGHYTLSHMGYFWCQGCSDYSWTAEEYVTKYLNMHEGLKESLAFDHDGNAETAEVVFEFAGIIPVRAGHDYNDGYREGEYTDTTTQKFYESFKDLQMTGPRVAQYWMINNSALSDIWGVCNIGEDWVWMPDGTNGVQDYFNAHYENGTVDYTTQVAQKESWYTPTTPKDVHDSIHYNQIGYNEIGRESARNALILLGEIDAPEVETTVELVSWDGYTLAESINASTAGNSETLVVPVVSPIWKSKEVTYILSDGLIWDYYDLLAENDGLSGALSSSFTQQTVTVSGHTWSAWETVFKPTAEGAGQEKRICAHCGLVQTRVVNGVWQTYSLSEHLVELPEDVCCDTNLWALLPHENVHFTSGKKWGNTSTPVTSVTIPINPGDRLFATSWQKAGENGHATSNGIRVTFFDATGIALTMGPGQTDSLFYKNGGYLEAPAGTVAINVAMWYDSEDYELYILNREHSYTATVTPPTCTEKGYTTYTCACGDSYVGDYVDADGEHDFTNWYTTKEATYNADGEESRDCQKCSHVEFRSVKLEVITSGNVGKGTPYTDDVTYTLYADGTMVISGKGIVYCSDWRGDYQPYKDYRAQIKTLIVEDGITTTAGGCFAHFYNLETVSLPDSLTKIGNNAFMSSFSGSVTDIVIPKTITYIGAYSYGFYYGKGGTTFTDIIIENPDVQIVDNNAVFNAGNNLENLTLYSYGNSNNVSAYAEKYGCKYVDLETYKTGVYSGVEYMYYDGVLTFSAAQNDATIAGEDAPWNAVKNNVKKIVIESGITGIAANAFKDYYNLESVETNNEIRYVGDNAFATTEPCDRTLTLALPRTVKSIGSGLFAGRQNVTLTAYLGSAAAEINSPGVKLDLKKQFKLLLIGNSYSEDASGCGQGMTDSQLLNILQAMLGEDAEITVALLSSGGKGMHWHATQAEQGNQAYGFRVITTTNPTWKSLGSYTSADALAWTDWDAVSLQPYNINPSTGRESVPYPDSTDQKFYHIEDSSAYMLDHVARYAPYADIYFYMHWAQTSGTVLNAALSNYNKAAAFMPTVLNYVGTESGARFKTLIPVGLSVQNARTTYLALLAYNTTAYADGNLNLVTDAQIGLQRDGGHLSFNIGRYIAALNFAEMIISPEMRAPGYTLPDIRATESIGVLPKEYSVIAQKAVWAAVESWKQGSLAVTEISGYTEDPAVTAKKELEAHILQTGCQVSNDALQIAISSLIAETLGADFVIESVTLPEDFTLTGKEQTFAATVSIRFGYTTVTVTVSGTIASHSYTATVTPPTCTEQGYTTYTCACGDSYVSDETAATGHSYNAVVTKPTCTEHGYTTYTCHCGDSYVDTYTEAAGHSFGAWETVKEAACTENGTQRRDCKNCEHYETKVIPATGHSYNAVVTKPTCTEQGYTTYTCHCGDSYVADQTPATGHSFGEWYIVKEATCTEQGLERRDCANCDHFETNAISATGHSYNAVVTKPTCTEKGYTTYTCHCGDSYVADEVPATGHSYQAWYTVKEPTCTVNGSQRRDCKNCDHYETKSIPATGHSYNAVVTNPTCTEQGYTTYTCHCGDSYVADQTPAKGHSFGDWYTVKEPTCTENGTQRRDCKNCDVYETKAIPATGHSYNAVVTKPTCTEQGYTTYTCHCGDSYVANQTSATGHSFGEWYTVKEPTCTENGSQRRDCKNCDVYETKSIPATGHDYNAVVTNPTCTAEGYTTYTCHCGDSYVADQTPATGHVFGEWYTVKETSCTENGTQRRDCKNCDHYETKAIPATGHDYNAVVTNPTCTEQGYTTYTCHCGDSYVADEVPATGHSYQAWYTVKEPTCTENGTQRRDCKNCDVYETKSIPATGHDYNAVVTNPTCTEQGYTTYTCHCGESYVADKTPAKGHAFGEWYTVKETSCTENGTQRRDCKNCDAYETKVITATGHSYTATITKPTCTAEGYTTYTCHCGDSYVADKTPATGHAFGNWETTKEATCTENGTQRRDCKNCDHYETKEIPATGHSYNAVVTKPTCTEQGYTTYTCHCGDSYVADQTPATGHSFGEWYTVKEATCTDYGMEQRNCKNCDHYEKTMLSATGHSFTSQVTQPTCSEMGYTTYICHCGYSYKSNYVIALGHIWDSGKVTVEPTEETEGEVFFTCTVCDETKIQILPVLDHVHRYSFTVTPPTCTEYGFTVYICRCGDTYAGNHIAPTGHTYTAVVTKPTCTAEGYTTYTCHCGNSYVGDKTSAIDHTYTAIVTKPTCTESGYTTYTCHCGDSYVSNYVQPTGHSYGEWYTVKEATCTADGSQRRDCKNCDHYETNTIPATGHSYNAIVTKPTCTEEGYTTYTCHCGDSYVADKTPAIGHSFGAWHTVKEATCTETGLERRDCKNCEHYETKEIPATGHSYNAVVTNPTCTEQGYTTYTCHCGDSYVADKTPAIGHSFGAWHTVKEATCTENGTQRRDCKNCDHYETNTIPATGHSYNAIVTKPTCTEEGYTTYTCHCGDSYVADKTPAIGHSFGEWYTVKEPTCNESGTQRRDCKNCDHYETNTIPATGHSYNAVVTKPTCTEEGYTTYTCHCGDSYVSDKVSATGHDYHATVTPPTCTEKGYSTHTCHCGDFYIGDYTPAAGHAWNNGVVTKEPTEETEGTMLYTCTACGDTKEETVPTLEHVHRHEATVTDPTCTEQGYTTYTCRCGDSYVADKTPAKGHSFDEWYTVKEAACSENGLEQRDCKNCDHFETQAIPATGHSYQATVTKPTCAEEGYTTYTCHCGDSYVSDYVNAIGHTWGEWQDVAPGKEERSCETCSETESRDKTPNFDVDGNGTVEEADLTLLMSILVGNTETEELYDFDFDGKLTIYDGVLLMQQLS